MKYCLLLTCVFLLFFPLFSDAQDGYVRASGPLQISTAPDIAPEIYGSFLEVIFDCYTGPFGFSAEEFLNRGFDFAKKDTADQPRQWRIDNSYDGKCYLKKGGYNTRGTYSLVLERNALSSAKFGVSQMFYTTPKTGLDFYVYARSDAYKGNVHIEIRTYDSSTILIDTILGSVTPEWKKIRSSFFLPSYIHKAIATIYIDSIGSVELDEASLMPQNNIFGVRKEQYDLYKQWGTTIIRFPGGGIADERQAKWEGNVGDRDQRITETNNGNYSNEYTRFEVGYDEFIKFCDTLGTKPQLTVNYGSGTPEEAASWVEYCHGSEDTKYGAMRVKNGYKQPFAVKYWEIGNEQYGIWETGHSTAENYATRYNEFHRLMKEKDSEIRLMSNGDTWSSEWNQKMLSINANTSDYFSVHWGIGLNINNTIFGDSLHKIAVRDGHFADFWYDRFTDQLRSYGLPLFVPIAKTENVFTYGGFHTYIDPRSSSMQHGLWSAIHMNMLIKNCSYMRLHNATVFAGVIRAGEHPKTGQRVIYGGASYHVNSLYCQTMRKYYFPLEIQSPMYDFSIFDYKWVDGVGTFDKDSVAVALVNTHPRNDITVSLDLPILQGVQGIVYSIDSPSLESYNSPENPTLISVSKEKKILGSSLTLPAHSVTVIVMPQQLNSHIGDSTTAHNTLEVNIVPNPSQHLAQVIIHTPTSDTDVTLELRNVLGEIIIPSFRWRVENNRAFIPVNTSVVSDGQYYWTIKDSTGKSFIYSMQVKK